MGSFYCENEDKGRCPLAPRRCQKCATDILTSAGCQYDGIEVAKGARKERNRQLRFEHNLPTLEEFHQKVEVLPDSVNLSEVLSK